MNSDPEVEYHPYTELWLLDIEASLGHLREYRTPTLAGLVEVGPDRFVFIADIHAELRRHKTHGHLKSALIMVLNRAFMDHIHAYPVEFVIQEEPF